MTNKEEKTTLIQYNPEDPEKDVFQDFAASGVVDGEEFNGSAKITEKVMGVWLKMLKGKKKLGTEMTVLDNKDNGIRFSLKVGKGIIHYSIANEGARGIYLNATWNPTRVLTGQNIFRVEGTGMVELEGLKLKLLPADVIEFPFRLFMKGVDEEEGKEWVGRGLLKKYLRDRTIYWRRIDLTTYSGQMPGKEVMQSILGVMNFMAGSLKVIGFDARDHRKALELSLRHFASVRFESYRGASGDFETVVFSKITSQGRETGLSLYRFSVYNKAAEVAVSGEKGNQMVIKKHKEEMKNRLRMELQLYPTSFVRVWKFSKIAGRGAEKWTTSGALAEAFPTLEEFDRRKKKLLVAAIEDLHLDYLLAPKNPYSLMMKAEKAVGDDEKVAVLKEWKRSKDKPLRGKNSLKIEGVTQREVKRVLGEMRDWGLDLTKISWLEACALWNTLVSSHLSVEEYEKLEWDTNRRMKGVSEAEELRMGKEATEIWRKAQARALETRGIVRKYLASSVVALNLGVDEGK